MLLGEYYPCWGVGFVLRLGGRRALPSFISAEHDKDVNQQNKVIIFTALDTLSGDAEDREKQIQETCVLAWGQLGRLVELAGWVDVMTDVAQDIARRGP